jgi:hypothetical protein
MVSYTTAFVIILLIVIGWLVYNDKDLQSKVMSYVESAKKTAGMAPTTTPAPTPATPAVIPPPEKKEGFCPKLMQKYGFCDAGEGMNSRRGTFYDQAPSAVLPARGMKYEGFNTRPGVSGNTLWDGYMKSSTLPGV